MGEALLVNVTTDPAAGAAAESVTAQLVLLLAANVAEVQFNAEIVSGVTGACSEIVAEAELPFNPAVNVAV